MKIGFLESLQDLQSVGTSPVENKLYLYIKMLSQAKNEFVKIALIRRLAQSMN